MSSARDALRRDFGGDIIEPGAEEYDAASRTVLASGSPAYVLRPTTVGDVQAGVGFARDEGLALAVRGGGHGFTGFGTNAGGVVIDLANLAKVDVIDQERHVVRIGGGATWGEVVEALAPHGLAISSGDTKTEPLCVPRYTPAGSSRSNDMPSRFTETHASCGSPSVSSSHDDPPSRVR